MPHSRKFVQDTFIRVCKDSGYKMDMVRAAQFTASVLDISSLEVWIHMGDMDNMERVANGTHPVCERN